METIKKYEQLLALNGLNEGRDFEIKSEPIESDELVKLIQAGANGLVELFRIVIGAEEVNGKFNVDQLRPLKFPLTVPRIQRPFKSFDEYRLHLISMVRESTSDYQEGFFDISEVEVPTGDGSIFVIEVRKSIVGPHQYRKTGAFYIREDGSCRPMNAAELRASFTRLVSVEESIESLDGATQLGFPDTVNGSQQIAWSRELLPGSIISRYEEGTGIDRNVTLIGGGCCWVKVEPYTYSTQWDSADLCDLIKNDPVLLRPLDQATGDISWGRNDFGAALWRVEADKQCSHSATQLYTDATIWSTDTSLLNKLCGRTEGKVELKSFVDPFAIEKAMHEGVPRLIEFSRKYLKPIAPLRISLGLHGIGDYRFWTGGYDYSGRAASGGVYHNFNFSDSETSVSVELNNFLDKLWKHFYKKRTKSK